MSLIAHPLIVARELDRHGDRRGAAVGGRHCPAIPLALIPIPVVGTRRGLRIERDGCQRVVTLVQAKRTHVGQGRRAQRRRSIVRQAELNQRLIAGRRIAAPEEQRVVRGPARCKQPRRAEPGLLRPVAWRTDPEAAGRVDQNQLLAVRRPGQRHRSADVLGQNERGGRRPSRLVAVQSQHLAGKPEGQAATRRRRRRPEGGGGEGKNGLGIACTDGSRCRECPERERTVDQTGIVEV